MNGSAGAGVRGGEGAGKGREDADATATLAGVGSFCQPHVRQRQPGSIPCVSVEGLPWDFLAREAISLLT